MENLRKLREAKGMTMSELGNQLGVTHAAVSGWETGTRFPSSDKLPKIAQILGCTIDDLFTAKAG